MEQPMPKRTMIRYSKGKKKDEPFYPNVTQKSVLRSAGIRNGSYSFDMFQKVMNDYVISINDELLGNEASSLIEFFKTSKNSIIIYDLAKPSELSDIANQKESAMIQLGAKVVELDLYGHFALANAGVGNGKYTPIEVINKLHMDLENRSKLYYEKIVGRQVEIVNHISGFNFVTIAGIKPLDEVTILLNAYHNK